MHFLSQIMYTTVGFLILHRPDMTEKIVDWDIKHQKKNSPCIDW